MSTTTDETTVEQLAAHFEAILRLIGEDPAREGLVKTPMRAAKALYYATKGYRTDVDTVVNGAVFTHRGTGMVIVRDIEFYSNCEHHILPFFGRISVGYMPDGKILGLSKLARIVDIFARRLQTQEHLTSQVIAEVARVSGARGVIARCEAQHLCMKMRGVEKQDSSTVTLDMNGVFDTDPSLADRFLAAIAAH